MVELEISEIHIAATADVYYELHYILNSLFFELQTQTC